GSILLLLRGRTVCRFRRLRMVEGSTNGTGRAGIELARKLGRDSGLSCVAQADPSAVLLLDLSPGVLQRPFGSSDLGEKSIAIGGRANLPGESFNLRLDPGDLCRCLL